MIETALRTVEEHPGYIAGRCYLGSHYVLHDENEKALELFNGFVELYELFPERTGFLPTEEDDYLFMGTVYFASVSNIQAANKRLDALIARNPDYRLLQMAETIVERAALNRWEKLAKDWEPKRRRVIYVDRSLPQVTDRPCFENTSVSLFYHTGLTFDNWEIGCFLDLPRESFLRDLEHIILDARKRYHYFLNTDEKTLFPDGADDRFLIHAVLFLTECKAEDRLPVIMGMLEENEPFFYDWFDIYFEECMIPAIYQLGQNQLDLLKNFMFIPNLTLLARDAVAQAVSRIAIHQPERKMEVVRWFQDVFQYFIDHRDDNGIVDTDLIGYMVNYCTAITAVELLDTIKTLFVHDLTSVDICGPLDDVEADFSQPVDEEEIQPFLTIFEQYNLFRDEQEGKNIAEDEIDDYDDLEEYKRHMHFVPESDRDRPDRSFLNKPQMPVTVTKTPGRNDPCPCGSGKKYKKCCLKP